MSGVRASSIRIEFDLVDDGEKVIALEDLGEVGLHVVAQVVEAELVVGRVGDVGVVGDLLLVLGHVRDDDADGHAEGVVDEAHPVGVALREVVVDRHHMHAATGQGVEVDRQRRHQGLALAGLHLGDVALVEEDAAHQLDVEGAEAEGAAGRLAGVGEGLGEEVVEGLALGEALPELGGLGAEPVVVEGAERGLERVDLLDEGADGLDLAVVRRSEHLLRDRSQSQHEQTSSNLKAFPATCRRPVPPTDLS